MFACDDHYGTCEIEDWKWTYTEMINLLQIEGVSTCDTGYISFRLYDGQGDTRKFIGVENALIAGHTFQAFKSMAMKPEDLSIKYSIQH